MFAHCQNEESPEYVVPSSQNLATQYRAKVQEIQLLVLANDQRRTTNDQPPNHFGPAGNSLVAVSLGAE
jgi:hypothetical protein